MCVNNILDAVFSGLTALGTIGACVMSLILSYGKYKHKLDCVFIWGAPGNYKPTLLISNLCSRVIVIRTIDVFYERNRVAYFNLLEDFKVGNKAIIPAESETRISLDADKFEFKTLKLCNDEQKEKKNTLKIVVTTSSGKKFTSKQKYSSSEVLDLLFGNGLFNDAS